MKSFISILFSCYVTLSFSQDTAVVFNGNDDYIEIPNSGALNIQTNLTAEAWVQLDKITGLNIIFSKLWCAGSDFGYYLAIIDGKIRWSWNAIGNCNSGSYLETNDVLFDSGGCHHIAVVHKLSGIEIYFDGVLKPYTIISGSVSLIHQSSEPFRVGIYKALSGQFAFFMQGKIDEIKIWNSVRSSAEINYSMNTALTGNEANLIAYYDFENLTMETSTVIVNKATVSGSSLNGVLVSVNPHAALSCAHLEDSDVGITENKNVTSENMEGISYKPNPFSESISITYSELAQGEEYRLVVSNLLGKDLIVREHLTGNETIISQSEIGQGVFIVQLVNHRTNKKSVFRIVSN